MACAVRQVGHDQLGRPVIYSCLKNVSDRKTEHNRMHMIATFQQVHIARHIYACSAVDLHTVVALNYGRFFYSLVLPASAGHQDDAAGRVTMGVGQRLCRSVRRLSCSGIWPVAVPVQTAETTVVMCT